jgi:hypothetical protein
MTFEDFFIKKRIDLPALKKAEPSLFSEFKTHFEQMGEKSFDYTKKYWLNKLRLQYLLAPEIKAEKPAVAEPVVQAPDAGTRAETTDTKSVAKVGFVPRFKAANIPKPVAEQERIEEKPPVAKESAQEISSPKPAYKPRFNMKNIPPKTEE